MVRLARAGRRQEDVPAGRLGDHGFDCGELAHHGAAVEQHGIAHGGASGQREHLGSPYPDGHSDAARLADRTGHRQAGVGDGLAIDSVGDVDEGLDVVDRAAHVFGQAAHRDQLASDVVHDDVLVTRWVKAAEALEVDVRASVLLERGDGLLVLLFDRDDAVLGTGRFHAQPHATHHGLGLEAHELLVLVEQGLALGGVADVRIHLRVELHVGGESGAASADHPRLSDLVYNRVSHGAAE